MTDVNSVELNKEKVAARAERQRVESAQNAEQRAKQFIRERASRRVQGLRAGCLGRGEEHREGVEVTELNEGVPKNVTFTDNQDEVDKETNDFRYRVESVLQDIKDLLVEKNKSYGNSALDPINVFSKSSAAEQIRTRLDDKLSRLYHGKEYGNEDTITDILGYLVLLKIAQKETN